MILAQIVKATESTGWHIDPGWVMATLMGILGYLLVRILNRLVRKQDIHDDKLVDHEVRLTVVEKKK